MRASYIWFGLTCITGVSLLIALALGSAPSQADMDVEKPQAKTEAALNTAVPHFTVSEESVPEIIERLNAISTVPINAELNINDSVRLSFAMQDVRLRDVLAEFAKSTKSEWYQDQEHNSINIVDVSVARNREHPMNIDLDSFEIVKKPKMEAVQELFSRSEILQKKFYLTFIYGNRVNPADSMTLRLKSVTPRGILNAIVESDGNLYWTIFSDDAYHYFNFWMRARPNSLTPLE